MALAMASQGSQADFGIGTREGSSINFGGQSRTGKASNRSQNRSSSATVRTSSSSNGKSLSGPPLTSSSGSGNFLVNLSSVARTSRLTLGPSLDLEEEPE